jgi:aspartyl protease family protein
VERRPPRGGSPFLRLALIAGIVAAIVGAVASSSPGALSGWDVAYAAPLSIILILMVMRLAVSTRPLGRMAKQLSFFLIAGTVLVVGYSYRDDLGVMFGRTMSSVVPGRGAQVSPGVMRFQADDGGQFVIDATVNGTAVRFLVDTGASGIALSKRDAQRLGFDAKDLRYTGLFSTANGTTRAAPVTLDAIKIGPMQAYSVHAWVNDGDLDQSLLGMSYLSTLGRVEIKGDTLTFVLSGETA